MLILKDWVFCANCKSMLQIDNMQETIVCLYCLKDINCKDFQMPVVSQTKDYPTNKWAQQQQLSEHYKTKQTIEQKCQNSKCDSNLCYFTAKQVRSADEGQTVFFECTKCSHKFTLNN